jgi:NifU-like protein
MHCSVMGREALEAAIENFKTGGRVKHTIEGKVICKCFNVTEKEIERAIADNHLTTVEQVTHYTKAGGGCGNCIPDIEAILARMQEKKESAGKMTNLQKIEKIQDVLKTVIRPALQNDGGDVELVDVDRNTVIVKLKKACANCPASGVTLRDFIQKELQDRVLPDLIVKEM